MRKLNLIATTTVMLLCSVGPAFAQTSPGYSPGNAPSSTPAVAPTAAAPSAPLFSAKGLASLGVGLALVGAALGFGKIGGSAMDAIARQPEAAPRIQTGMLIIAAMLEGASLAAIVLAFVIGSGAAS